MTTEPAPEDADRDAATEALLATSRLLTALVSRTLAAVEQSVTVPQLRVLVMLAESGPRTLATIADQLGVNPSNASRACVKLAAADLLVRRVDPDDRRQVAMSLSPKGERLVGQLMAARRALIDELVGELAASDQRHLARGLAALLAAAEEGSGPDGATSPRRPG